MPRFRVYYHQHVEVLFEVDEVLEAADAVEAFNVAQSRLELGLVTDLTQHPGKAAGFPWVEKVEPIDDAEEDHAG